MTDLFTPPATTKKAQLLEWIRERGVVRTHEVLAYGVAHFSNRADRDARDLASKGLLRRLTDTEKIVRFGSCKEDAWVATRW